MYQGFNKYIIYLLIRTNTISSVGLNVAKMYVTYLVGKTINFGATLVNVQMVAPYYSSRWFL